MEIIRVFFVVILSLASTLVFSSGWTSSVNYGDIVEINHQPEGAVVEMLIVTKNIGASFVTCGVKDKFRLDPSTEKGKRLFSTVLAAFTAKKKVKLFIDDSSCNPWDMAKVTGIYVKHE